VFRRVVVNGRRLDVRLSAEGSFRIGEREGRASVIELEPGLFSIIVDGRCYEARVRNGSVYVNGERYAVDIEDPRAAATGLRGSEGSQAVKAAMPGKVIRVLVAESDEVIAGQGLLVIEAMKMQNELKAPRAGRVAAIPVREGATVSAGDTLAVIE
jgi:biotin carboxyl carrier protein